MNEVLGTIILISKHQGTYNFIEIFMEVFNCWLLMLMCGLIKKLQLAKRIIFFMLTELFDFCRYSIIIKAMTKIYRLLLLFTYNLLKI